MEKKRVLVAMSGGVDSSVAAALLKNQGYDVIGVHMKLWDQGTERFESRCCSITDSSDARRVCEKLDIPYYVINSQEVFKSEVVDYFVHEYLQQRTPNPCVMCNHKIKFNYLFQKADELKCDYVATGHYAQVMVEPASGESRLNKAIDAQKDQSYFLFGMTQAALLRTLMPLGGLTKPMVRRLAQEFGFTDVAQKPDSQEICFVGNETYRDFIEKRTVSDVRPRGAVRTFDGVIVGEHQGLHRFTIGQKKGIPFHQHREENDYFVIGFDQSAHALVVGPESLLFKTELVADQLNWIRKSNPLHVLECKARIRSRHEESECSVTLFENHTAQVKFSTPQRAITPGQAIVFYDNEEVLGGGFIQQVGTV